MGVLDLMAAVPPSLGKEGMDLTRVEVDLAYGVLLEL